MTEEGGNMPWSDKTVKGKWIASSAVIHPSAKIGVGVYIGANVVIHPHVRIGNNATIHDNSVIGRPKHRPNQEITYSEIETTIMDGAVVGTNVTIYTGTYIGSYALIGDGVRIREDCHVSADCIVGSNCTFQRDVFMGAGSRVIDLSHITNGVIIGEGAFVSTGVLTMDDDSFNKNYETDPTLRPPIIGPRASVGGGAILLPGVEVGIGAVVAAGAVATKSVAAGSVVMGVPAKEKHDLGYHGIPGSPSHALLGREPIRAD